jgi:hypothetical protein
MTFSRTLIAAAALLPLLGLASPVQAQPAPQQQPATPQQPAPPVQPQTGTRAYQQSQEWANLPKMVLERQFSGPLQDTVIQRWRDPVDGTLCYIYLPISAPHSPPNATGFVQYGSNAIGSISCQPATAASRNGTPARRP